MPTPYARFHESVVHRGRVRALTRALVDLLPPNADVVDVGCGDGLISRRVMDQRPDVTITGVDVIPRKQTHIPVEYFDGKRIPLADDSKDVAIIVDVLHHTEDPLAVLREALRVTRNGVLLKDHTTGAPDPLARRTLIFMDWMGNARHNIPLPYNFLTRAEWDAAFAELGVRETQRREKLGLYPWPATLVFERHLHFVSHLVPESSGAA